MVRLELALQKCNPETEMKMACQYKIVRMLRCVTIDDEPLARECIVNYVNEVDFLTSVGTGKTPLELVSLLQNQSVDLVFLDIQMPVMNGLDFLKMTAALPMVIITTAYPSYALEGFQLDVLDYLVKPITFDRFSRRSVKRAITALLTRSQSGGDHGPNFQEKITFL